MVVLMLSCKSPSLRCGGTQVHRVPDIKEAHGESLFLNFDFFYFAYFCIPLQDVISTRYEWRMLPPARGASLAPILVLPT